MRLGTNPEILQSSLDLVSWLDVCLLRPLSSPFLRYILSSARNVLVYHSLGQILSPARSKSRVWFSNSLELLGIRLKNLCIRNREMGALEDFLPCASLENVSASMWLQVSDKKMPLFQTSVLGDWRKGKEGKERKMAERLRDYLQTILVLTQLQPCPPQRAFAPNHATITMNNEPTINISQIIILLWNLCGDCQSSRS